MDIQKRLAQKHVSCNRWRCFENSGRKCGPNRQIARRAARRKLKQLDASLYMR